jgi:hypothetical protein
MSTITPEDVSALTKPTEGLKFAVMLFSRFY